MQKTLTFPCTTEDSQLGFELNFLAVQLLPASESISIADWQCLSPHVMHWQEDVYLIDLRSCASYWHAEAQAKQQRKCAFLQTKIEEIICDAGYRAVLAQDPWQAILLLPYLDQSRLVTVVERSSQMGENLWQNLQWDDWWNACSIYAEHSNDKRLLAELHSRRPSMQLAMRRLGYHRLAQLKSMPSAQIQRRFGALISKLWAMTWQPARNAPHRSGGVWQSADFPWHDELSETPLACRRLLDHPLQNWEFIETYLRDDLNQLCRLSSFKKGERILAMEWRVVLDNLQNVSLFVPFRHPHSLHQDLPDQRTALLQIYYALQEKIRSLRLGALEGSGFWLISWELCLTQRLHLATHPQTLFNDEPESSGEELLKLENQLLRPLEAYALNDDWVPEDSFCTLHQSPSADSFKEAAASFWELGRNRPLYLRRKFRPLIRQGPSLLWKFRERVMEKWWLKSHATSVLDYYQVLCDEQLLWVARDTKGDCLVHGVYG